MAEQVTRISSVGATDRLVRGAIGGVVAGIVFAMITMIYTSITGPGVWAGPRMIATILLGQEGFAPTFAAGPVMLGLAFHMMLSAVYGVIFALASSAIKTPAAVLAGGAVYGLLLYVVNFLVISPAAFPVFGMANQGFQVIDHMIFGLVLGAFFLSRRQ